MTSNTRGSHWPCHLTLLASTDIARDILQMLALFFFFVFLFYSFFFLFSQNRHSFMKRGFSSSCIAVAVVVATSAVVVVQRPAGGHNSSFRLARFFDLWFNYKEGCCCCTGARLAWERKSACGTTLKRYFGGS